MTGQDQEIIDNLAEVLDLIRRNTTESNQFAIFASSKIAVQDEQIKNLQNSLREAKNEAAEKYRAMEADHKKHCVIIHDEKEGLVVRLVSYEKVVKENKVLWQIIYGAIIAGAIAVIGTLIKRALKI